MEISRLLDAETITNASPVAPLPMQARLGRLSTSVWSRPSREGLVVTTLTLVACVLSCVIVETSLAFAFVQS